jgi:hypothetical protein
MCESDASRRFRFPFRVQFTVYRTRTRRYRVLPFAVIRTAVVSGTNYALIDCPHSKTSIITMHARQTGRELVAHIYTVYRCTLCTTVSQTHTETRPSSLALLLLITRNSREGDDVSRVVGLELRAAPVEGAGRAMAGWPSFERLRRRPPAYARVSLKTSSALGRLVGSSATQYTARARMLAGHAFSSFILPCDWSGPSPRALAAATIAYGLSLGETAVRRAASTSSCTMDE